MSTETKDLSVRRTLVIAASQARAFSVFTSGMTSWWPPSHHIGKAPLALIVVEPRAGGRWYERGDDGSECEWGRVLVWQPNERVAFSWHLDGDWQYQADPASASEVEIQFVPKGPKETEVVLIHRHIERHAGAVKVFEGVGSPQGWNGLLQLFRQSAEAA